MTKKSLLSPPAPNSISPGSRSRTLPSSRSRACCLASSRGKAHPAQRSSKRLPRSMGCREPWLRCGKSRRHDLCELTPRPTQALAVDEEGGVPWAPARLPEAISART
jgi:hypothetical protein